MINPLRGMKDLSFDDARRYEYIVDTASKIVRRYGYSYIKTPILEETALFKRSVGENSDIVGKEMYQFEDKGGKDVCMRPEGTAGVVRSFVSSKLDRLQGKYKFYYHGPMFRYERPQRGRLREFHQFGCESFGEASIYEDLTIIQMVAQIFDELGIAYKLLVNSLGCPNCMPQYRSDLVGYLESIKYGLCKECNRRTKTNPVRVLDCKNENCQKILKNAPKLINNLCKSCNSDFNTIVELLDGSGIVYEVDSHLVRGLDYYSKTAFEFISNKIGSQSAIAGGGRYDRLIEFLDGKPTPAVGFAIGIERIMELVQMPPLEPKGYYMGVMVPEALSTLLNIASKKRLTEKVVIEYTSKGFKSHLKSATKTNARYVILIGADELKNGKVWHKDLISEEEKIISIASSS